MIVGAAVIEIHIHGSQSLKAKRGVVHVDPSWGETEINATHIRSGAGSNSLGAMAVTWSGIKFEVKHVARKKVEEPGKKPPRRTRRRRADTVAEDT